MRKIITVLTLIVGLVSFNYVTAQSCDTLRNYDPNADYYIISGATIGYLSGHMNLSDGVDNYNMVEWAEPYQVSTSSSIKSLRVAVARAQNNSGSASVTFKVYNDAAGFPGAVIGTEVVSYDDLQPQYYNTVDFTTPVTVNGNFWVGYEISYSQPIDTFALYTFIPGSNGTLYMNASSISGTGLFDGWDSSDQWITIGGNPGHSHSLMDVLVSSGVDPELDEISATLQVCSGTDFEGEATATGSVDNFEWYLTNDPFVTNNDILEGPIFGSEVTIPANYPPGTYLIYCFANGACTSDGVYFQIEILESLSATVTSFDASCGEDNGMINFTNSSGGNPPYYYTIDAGNTWSTTSSYSNLPAGDYLVAVDTDDEDVCPYIEEITIADLGTVPATPAISTSNPSCSSNGTAAISNYDAGNTYFFTPAGPTVDANGNISNLNPGITYSVEAEGTGCVSSSTSFSIQAQLPLDDASFAYASSTFCIGGDNETPTITGIGGGTFSASAGLVINSSTGEIDLGASGEGQYTVTYTTNGTCPNTFTQTINLTSSPSASFTYANNAYCVNDGNISPTFGSGASAGTFSSTSGLAVNASTGVIDLANSTPGTYTVTNTIPAQGSCDASSETFEITVNALPTVYAGNNMEICTGEEVTLTATGDAASYSWDNGIQDGIAFTPASTGTYTVTGISADGCEDTDQITVTVNEIPTIEVGDDQEICAGEEVTLTATVSGGTVTWDNAVTDGIAFTPNGTTTYTATVDDNGCTASASVTVVVNDAPTVNAGSDVDICAGEEVTLTATVSGGTVTWDNGITDGVAFTPASTGTYTATVEDNGCSASDAVQVTVHENPTVSANDETACDDDSPFALEGTPSGGTFSGDNVSNNTFDPAAAGEGTHTVTYTYTDQYGCSGEATATITVEICEESGIAINEMVQLLISPNPASEYVTVQTVGASIKTIQIMSIEGQVVTTGFTKVDNQTSKIDVSSIAKGTYLIQVSTEYGLVVKKVIVQ